ncbi:MAG: hypothetical protein GY765_38245, partial [bacterium]|nr:hypothetical protein [bacterium]
PEPGETAGISTEYQAPTNETEKKLTAIWQEVLALEQIGVTDNFFEIGGHSLKAITLIAGINKTFQVELPLPVFFAKPFIESQAHYIDRAGTSTVEAIQPAEKREYYPLSAAQKRMVTLNRFAPDSVNYNMPGALYIEGDLSTTTFKETIQKLVHRHQSLRTSFHFVHQEPLQRIHDKIEFTITYSQISENTIERAISRFLRPFSLSQAPLLRVELV